MKSILGIGNALTDILAVLPDDTLLKKYNLPLGSMQHVDAKTGNTIWADLKEIGVQYVAGGSAANTVTATAILGMPSGYIGKVGDDELGSLFRQSQMQIGIKSNLLVGTVASGRAMVFITAFWQMINRIRFGMNMISDAAAATPWPATPFEAFTSVFM